MFLKRAALAAWLVSLSSATCAQFTFQPLPGLGDSILKLSADGQTVAANLRIGGIDRAVRWTAATGVQPLGSLPGGDGSSMALGLSADGRFIVGRGRSARGLEAFVWSEATGMQGLGDLPSGSGQLNSWASDISADGQVVVGQSNSGTSWRAFRWAAGDGFTDLGSLGQGFSSATAVSRDGTLVVGASRSAAGQEAFRWTAAGGMQALGGLAGGGVTQSAQAVSGDGTVIVGAGASPLSFHAFRWTAAGGAIALGTFDPGNPGSSAAAVSADGRVIVGMGSGVNADGNGEAFVWFPGRGILDLRKYLLDHGLGAVQGWRLSEATGVSDDGRTLLGWGIDPAGARSAWLAHIDIDDFPAPPPALPAAPSNLSGTATAARVTLRWADNAGNETGYRVETCIGTVCTGFVTMATLGPNATGFVDERRGRGQVFRYRVRAFNAAGNSAYSNVISVETPRR
jgi:probable HAF family extracellular repeat protein